MLKNYFKISWRTLVRNKAFSLINILGLGLGVGCSLVILLWVKDEYSVDSFHKNGAQLYAVYERQYVEGNINAGYYTPGPLGEELKNKIPEVMYASSSRQGNDISTFEVGDKIIKEKGNFAGDDFFKMFSYQLLTGNRENALNSPSSIAISRKMAEEFFGSVEGAMGKVIRYEDQKNYAVSAVFENLPTNISDKFDYLISWRSFIEDHPWAKEWDGNSPRTYVMLRADADPATVEKKIKDLLKNYHKNFDARFRIELGLQKFGDIYLHGDFKNGYPAGGRIEYVQIFSIVAIIILLIACINFMNLTTARSIKRAKEIGVRKVTGATRFSMIIQFMSEAMLFAVLSVVFALILVALVLPAFNLFTGKEIKLPYSDFYFWIDLIALTVLTGSISGCYPALFLSSFDPVKILKGTLKFTSGVTLFRKGLVVFQFVLSIILITGTIIISKQIKYIGTKDLGFNREDLIYVPLDGDLATRYELLKDEGSKIPGIAGITRITSVPTQIYGNTLGVDWQGKDPNSKPLFTTAEVGYEFIKTMKLQLKDGRDFSKDFAADSANYLINESTLQKIGYNNPIGKPLSLWGVKGQIVGVLKDFHFNSLHEPISPLIIKLGERNNYGSALVRIERGKTNQALSGLATICKKLNPQFPFEFEFADADYQSLYKSEQVINKLGDYFAFLAIFISCLGLLGLVMFTAERRIKEIGIRKVLGASVISVFQMLSKEFLVLVFLAMVIGSPVAWFTMNKWLQEYAYHTEISWWMFAVSGLLAMMIALITVSYQTMRSARANPVKSLRME